MLKLPLKYYDESGRILPPAWFYSLLIVLCLDWLAFIFSLASRTQTNELLAFFYPQKESLGLGLVASLPVLVALVLVSQRERLWQRNAVNWRLIIVPLVHIGIVAQLSVQLFYAMHHHWGFEYVTGVKIVTLSTAFYAVTRSRHLKWMIKDWAAPDTQNTDTTTQQN